MASGEHPDVSYVKDPEIGQVIAVALSQLYKAQPDDPVHFLGSWLLNHHSLNKGKAALSTS